MNKHGWRFCDERQAPERKLHEQPEGLAYIVLDDALAERFSHWPHFISTAPGVAYAYLPDYRRNRRDIYAQAATLELLGRRLGMQPGEIERSVMESNQRNGWNLPLLKPPFHALGPVSTWLTVTEGGLKVDTHLRVLRADGSPIAGLFAAGANGQGGLLLEGHGHHLGWAFTSGRLAGAQAAAFERGGPA